MQAFARYAAGNKPQMCARPRHHAPKPQPPSPQHESAGWPVRLEATQPGNHAIKRQQRGSARRTLRANNGSTMAWAATASIVLLILAAVIALAVSRSFTNTAQSSDSTQAYYTARTINERVVSWLGYTPTSGNGTEQQAFLSEVKKSPGRSYTQHFTSDDLGGSMGTADTDFSINAAGDKLTITTTAAYNGQHHTTVSTFEASGGSSLTIQNGDFSTASSFSLASINNKLAKVNNLPVGLPLQIGDSKLTDNSGANKTEANAISASIKNASSEREVQWTSQFNSTYDIISGTQMLPANNTSKSTDTDSRRFQSGANGRLLINPMEKTKNSDTYCASSPTAPGNTKIFGLSIDTSAAGKNNVTVRFANAGVAAMPKPPCNALITMAFTDNANKTDSKPDGFTFHPYNWPNIDFLIPRNSGIGSTNIIMGGPFYHKFKEHFDYYSYGNYVDNWVGKTPDIYSSLWPETKTGRKPGTLGLATFEVTYTNASIWALDGADSYLRLMQGTNIVNGSIYSTRPLILGGALVGIKNDHDRTTDNINNKTTGWSFQTSGRNSDYVPASVRYDQRLYDVDIILPDTNSTPHQSEIRAPNTWRDKVASSGVPSDSDKRFNPIMLISGGTIYIGKNQYLTIQGTSNNDMTISPTEIVVASYGSLTLNPSSSVNVRTNIFVSGSVNLKSGSAFAGNIYVEAGGDLNLNGSASVIGNIIVKPGGRLRINGNARVVGDIEVAGEMNLDGILFLSPPVNLPKDDISTPWDESDPQNHGVFIYDSPSIGTGKLTVTSLSEVYSPTNLGDSAPRIHSFANQAAITGNLANKLFCIDRDPGSNICSHFTTTDGLWVHVATEGG